PQALQKRAPGGSSAWHLEHLKAEARGLPQELQKRALAGLPARQEPQASPAASGADAPPVVAACPSAPAMSCPRPAPAPTPRPRPIAPPPAPSLPAPFSSTSKVRLVR